jgi:hypothetical protein
MQTISEKLFESFCVENEIPLDLIATESAEGQKTPDYIIDALGNAIVVEVKQIDPNPEDLRHFRDLVEKGTTDTIITVPGHRVRGKISDAMPQLKARTKNKLPGLLVLYNNVKLIEQRIDPIDIKTAMYGHEVVEVSVPKDPADRRIFARHRFGSDRKVSNQYNTSLSAVSSLYESDQSTRLDIFHNDFAANPIDPMWLQVDSIRHFRLSTEISRGGLREWVEIPVPDQGRS